MIRMSWSGYLYMSYNDGSTWLSCWINFCSVILTFPEVAPFLLSQMWNIESSEKNFAKLQKISIETNMI
jgi:hypothetical protein